MKHFLSRFFVIALTGLILWFFLQYPSHERDWEAGQEQLPYITILDDTIFINNFRDFRWYDSGSGKIQYITKRLPLSLIESVDVIISHFSDFEGLAHIFLSFGFSNGEHVVISLETRRENGEEFSPLLGLLRQFETIYIVGSERDILGLRTDIRDERVYVYPTIATPLQARELFVRLTEDINDVYRSPKFYNTLFNNCTNALTRRVEEMTDIDFPLTYKSFFPGYFDKVLYEMGIIPQNEFYKFANTKESYRVDNAAVDRTDKNYSNSLRRR